MNEELEQLFKNFIVNEKHIDVSFLVHKGKNEDYIVYSSIGETPQFWGNNEVLASIDTYDFDIYTKGNYLNILKKIKEKLKDSKWTWVEDSEDMYEEDTGYFHKTTTWSKERIDY